MKARGALCLVLIVALLVCLCVPVLAEAELFFVAVNDTIPLTLTVFPTYSGGTLYVPYQVFDAQPCGVTPSYNQTKQTYVLLSRNRQMLFDLAAGTVKTENGTSSTANVLYKNGNLYLPLSFCASHFGLKTTLLESADGYQILRFTDGSEVYDDSLFVQKAENLIAYRVQQYTDDSQTAQKPADRPSSTDAKEPIPEKKPATVYLAFTNAQTMRESMQALARYSLHGTFFLTADEICTDPALVFELLAAGHTLGLNAAQTDAEADPLDALQAANDALYALLCQKTLLALLPANSEAHPGYCCFFQPSTPVTAAQAVDSETTHLLLCSGEAASELYTLFSAEAHTLQLLETSEPG